MLDAKRLLIIIKQFYKLSSKIRALKKLGKVIIFITLAKQASNLVKEYPGKL